MLDSWVAMDSSLTNVLRTLRAHEGDLRRLGVCHAAVFGSVARGEASTGSDIDVLVDLDREQRMGIFEYARLKLYIGELLDGASDVVNRKTLKPLLRENILRDAVDAFYEPRSTTPSRYSSTASIAGGLRRGPKNGLCRDQSS